MSLEVESLISSLSLNSCAICVFDDTLHDLPPQVGLCYVLGLVVMI